MLTVKTIQALVKAEAPGMWAHGQGLYLVIAKSGSASWAFRYSLKDGKRRVMTLARADTIDKAGLLALELETETLRKRVKAGDDPLTDRQALESEPTKTSGRTFKDAALDYVATFSDSWKNPKHKQQWENTLATYTYPLIGEKPILDVDTNDIMTVLYQPYKGTSLWDGARETARRVRMRIEAVIDNEWTDDETFHRNPARLEGYLKKRLERTKKQVKSNFKAMDWKEVPAFARELSAKTDYSAKALLFTILCATRTNETLGATRPEITDTVWTIPADRMKAGREHRVPLSSGALRLLDQLKPIDGNPHLFPGIKKEQSLSNMAMLEALRGMRGDGLTVHGFRSAFRDWVTETTTHSDTIAELALAHTINDKTEKAYRRGDALERRKALMQQWCDYLTMDHASYAQKWTAFLA